MLAAPFVDEVRTICTEPTADTRVQMQILHTVFPESLDVVWRVP